MHLTFGTGEEFPNPTTEQITIGLEELTGFGDSFAILSESEMSYIQTSGGQATGFLVEYQVESLDDHHRSLREDLPLETVQALFLAYAEGDDSWRSAIEWVPDDLARLESSSMPAALGYVLAAFGICLLVWWVSGWGLD